MFALNVFELHDLILGRIYALIAWLGSLSEFESERRKRSLALFEEPLDWTWRSYRDSVFTSLVIDAFIEFIG